MEEKEIDGSLVVHGVIGIGDFSDGNSSHGLDCRGPLQVDGRFHSLFQGPVHLAQVFGIGDDDPILVNTILGVTKDLKVDGTISALGDIRIVGADLAERFDTTDDAVIDPGSVVVLDEGQRVRPCSTPYDQRVAGIVAGAGGHRPGLVLNEAGKPGRPALALAGRAWCKVDADSGPVQIGDLLTTSGTNGHAMRATDRERAFGAVIGKALAGLDGGCGLIPVLVSLR